MGKTVATSFILLFFCTITHARTVELDGTTKKYDLGLFTDYLEDAEGDMALDDVMSTSIQDQWKRNTAPIPNFAFSKSVYWLRINFRALPQTNNAWLFEIAFPLQDYIDFYVVKNKTVTHSVMTGDRRFFNTREKDYRNFLFSLDIPPGEERQVYIRLDTADGLHEPCPMILWHKEEFVTQHGFRNLGLGLYFGMTVVMALYNLFLYVSIRDRAYLYYVAYIFGFTFWLFTYYGFSYQYLWPKSPVLGNLSTVVTTCIWAIFVALFVTSFLNSAKQLPWFHKLMKAYIGSMLFTIALSFLGNYSLGILAIVGFGIPAAFSGIVAGIQSWRSGYGPARFFLLAWSALLLSLIIFCLKIAGVLPSIWVIERSVQIGSAIEVVLLSLGLADRINKLKKDKIAAQQEAIESYQSNIKLKNDFITSISHELRTPMNAILGGLEVEKEKHQDDLSESLRMMYSGANDMMRLVDDILIHTELQAGQLAVRPKSANVKTALDRLKEYYSPICDEKGLEYCYEVDSRVPDWIVVDAHKLSVILTKLLSNAVKFTEQGKVTLTVTVNEDAKSPKLVCIVSDTGPGIALDKQTLIFDPFVQIEGGFTRRHQGMGIGLSICRRLAEMLDGSLSLESTPGAGSSFTLTLPLTEGESVSEIPKDKLAPPSLPVLVVEDNIVNQQVTAKMLDKLGLQCAVANHGEEAIRLIENNTYALILMDLQMPIMDGFTCTEKIRKANNEYSDIPIIAVTANVMDKDKARCFSLKMDDFLEKPLKLNILRACLSKYVQFPS